MPLAQSLVAAVCVSWTVSPFLIKFCAGER